MAYEKVIRNRYHEPGSPDDPEHTSANHSDDFQDFHVPMERMHNSNLHDWGIASGLEVSGTIDGTNIIVSPGVAIDSTGQLISLSSKGNISSSLGSINEVNVPVNLSTVIHAGKTVYVTIQFSESLRSGGVTGKLEQVPWTRLQSVDTLSTPDKDSLVNGKTLVLAIAVINAQGKLAELKVADNDHSRRLIGQTIEELRIQRPGKTGDKVENKLSGMIGSGEEGGLKVTLPDTQDSILFARENGSNSAKLEIDANVGIGTRNPKEKFDVSGTIRLFGKNAFQGNDSFLRINQDNQFEDGTHFAHRANFAGGITTGDWWNVEPGWGNLLVQNNVGIGTDSPSAPLQVAGKVVAEKLEVSRDITVRNLEVSRNITVRNQEFGGDIWVEIGSSAAVVTNSDIWINGGNLHATDITADGNIWVEGNLTVRSGSKSAAVAYPDGTYHRLYSIESPESWFEDFGRGELVEGHAYINIDPDFAQIVKKYDYHVFISPEGNSNGLYVTDKSPEGFKVLEQQGGTSSLAFSYRIVAKRKDLECERLANVNISPIKEMLNH